MTTEEDLKWGIEEEETDPRSKEQSTVNILRKKDIVKDMNTERNI